MRERYGLILLALLILAAPSLGREPKKPSEMFAEKESDFLRAIAAKYVESADVLKKEKLNQYARMLYEEALKYEENNRKARKNLGFVRKGRDWWLDPVEAKKLPNSNSRPQGISEQLFKEQAQKRYEEVKEKADVFTAKRYASLGKWCEKEGLNDQAKKAYEKAVIRDPENEVARKGLGYEKVGDEWLTPKQQEARREAKEGKLVNDSPSRFEGPMGVKLNKMESAHFRIETVYPVETLKSFTKNCETTYAYFLRDVGEAEIKDVFGKKAFFLVLGSVEQWHKYVDTFGTGSEQQKEFTKKCQGSAGDPNLFAARYGEDGNIASTIDGMVHRTAHFMVHHYWNIDHAWLKEGFAYYYTVKILESTHSHCVALGDYNSQTGGMKDWGQSENWKDLVKKEVLEAGDPDIRMIFKIQIKDLQYNQSVKAWSVISWLFDKHREKFMQFLEAIGHGGKDQESAFQEVFGWSLEEVDIAWREFVRENY
jgi:tetratricopeptide (TPR) repeat protein